MKKKFLVAVLCIVMMAIGGLATWAYFTDSHSVENTFTVGNVDITLDESETDVNGKVIGDRQEEGNEYHLVPGHEYVKDPSVHVLKGSDECYVYVKLENGLKGIIDTPTLEAQMAANGWAPLGEGYENIYVYNRTITKEEVKDANKDLPVFASFKVKGAEVTNDSIKEYETKTNSNAKIVVTAYAVQKDTFDSALAAWNATYGK